MIRGIKLKLFDYSGIFRAERAAEVSLREQLRGRTRQDHKRLDEALTQLDLSRPGDYARFLRFHAVARAGVEQWLDDHAPADLRPPAQLRPIGIDLEALGAPAPSCAPAFVGPSAGGWLGVAYVVAGSHLGNRVLLRQIDGDTLPTAFLSGAAMQDYWKRLRPLLDEPCGPAAATGEIVEAARATFAHFSQVAATTGAVLPA